MATVLALSCAAFAALAWYAASPHCRWRVLRGRPRAMRVAAVMLALLSLAAWVHALGAAVGACAMLGSLMLAAMALPWLALGAGETD